MTDEPVRHGDLMLMGRLVAATDMLGRAGASEFEVAFDDDTGYERVPVLWWATAKWGGARLDSGLFPYPAQAAEDLLARALNGGECTWCGRTTVVGLVTEGGGLCNYVLVADDVDVPDGYRYRRSCEAEGVQVRMNRAERRRRERGR